MKREKGSSAPWLFLAPLRPFALRCVLIKQNAWQYIGREYLACVFRFLIRAYMNLELFVSLLAINSPRGAPDTRRMPHDAYKHDKTERAGALARNAGHVEFWSAR